VRRRSAWCAIGAGRGGADRGHCVVSVRRRKGAMSTGTMFMVIFQIYRMVELALALALTLDFEVR
jgi:hypothetical protein